MGRPIRAVLALLVLLAGCSGATPGGTPTAVPTPAPVPDLTPTPTRTPPPVDGPLVTATGPLAPGLTAEGVRDAVALAEAHFGTLRGQNVTVERTTVVRYGNGTTRRLDERVLLDAAGERSLAVVTLGNTTRREWTEERTALVRTDRDGVVEYRAERARPETVRSVYRRSFLGLLVAADGARVTRMSEGGADYRVTANVDTLREAESPFGLDPDPGRLTLFVAESGFVVGWDLRYRASERDGTPVAVTTRLRHTDVGTTAVERPAWTTDALAATGENATTTT